MPHRYLLLLLSSTRVCGQPRWAGPGIDRVLHAGHSSGSVVSDKFREHTYETMYGLFLAPLQSQPRVKMLEVGLGCDMTYGPGASASLWRRLLPDAEIWMADVDGDCVAKHNETLRALGIRALVGDQTDRAKLRQWLATAGGRFDLVIDDGRHSNSQVLTTFQHLWRAVNPGGLYFMEDLQVGRLELWDDTNGTAVISDVIQAWIEQLLIKAEYAGQRLVQGVTTSRAYESIRRHPLPRAAAFVFCQHEACVIGKRGPSRRPCLSSNRSCATRGPQVQLASCRQPLKHAAPATWKPCFDFAYVSSGKAERVTSMVRQSAREGLNATLVKAATPGSRRVACARRKDLPHWSPKIVSVHLANLDAWRAATACPGRCEWLLVFEDDAELPHGFVRLLELVTAKVSADIIWLDARAGPYRHGPGTCCFAGMLYRKRIIPQLLEHFAVGQERDRPCEPVDHKPVVTDLWLLQFAESPDFDGRSAVVPIVGTLGFNTTAQDTDPSVDVTSRRWLWHMNSASWPGWLRTAVLLDNGELSFPGAGAPSES